MREEKKITKKILSRRDFIKTSAFGVTAASMNGIATMLTSASTAKARSSEVYKLRFGYPHSSSTPDGIFNLAWTAYLTKKSEGRLQFKHYPSNQLAKSAEILTALKNGVCDMADFGTGYYAGTFPLHEMGQLPMIMPESYAGAMTMWELHQKYPEFRNEIERQGIKIIAYGHGGGGNIFTTKKHIRTMLDLKGLILIETGQYNVEAAKLLGYTPESVDPLEQYDAVAKGVVDGIDSNYIAHVRMGKTYESCDYATEIGLCGSDKLSCINTKTYNKLPEDLQQLLTDSANVRKVITAMGYQWDKANSDAKIFLEETLQKRGKEGIYVLPEKEKNRWMEAVEPLIQKWTKTVSGIVGEVKANEILTNAKTIYATHSYTDDIVKKAKTTLEAWGIPY